MSNNTRTFSKKLDFMVKNMRYPDPGDFRPAATKLFQYGTLLPKDKNIAIQLEPNDVKHINCYMLTNSEELLNGSDLNWIFEKISVVDPVEGSITEEFGKGRKVYEIVPSKVFAGQDEHPVKGYYMDDLMAEIAQSGLILRIVIGHDECSSRILVSTRGDITLKQRTILSLVFVNTDLQPAGKAQSKTGFLDTGYIAQYVMYQMYQLATCAVDELEEPDTFIDELLEDELFEDEPDQSSESTPVITPDSSIEELGLSIRTYNCLKKACINQVKDLQKLSRTEISKIRLLGKNGAAEVFRIMDSCQLSAAPEPVKKDYLRELDELVGLEDIKAQVKRIAAFVKMKKAMSDNGEDKLSMAMNMKFIGNPGTAKTTVARIIAGIFFDLGITESPDIVEVGRGDLVAEYTGQTAPLVKKVFQKARGRVLFIDEAYSLSDTNRNSFGDEAINTIVQEMENHRHETIVIFGGYPEPMEEFFDHNPGLRSRVPFTVEFKDYSAETMAEIAKLEAKKKGFKISPKAMTKIVSLCREAARLPESGNGRFSRNLVENAILNFAVRNYGLDCDPNKKIHSILIAEDIEMPAGLKQGKPEKKFGFA